MFHEEQEFCLLVWERVEIRRPHCWICYVTKRRPALTQHSYTMCWPSLDDETNVIQEMLTERMAKQTTIERLNKLSFRVTRLQPSWCVKSFVSSHLSLPLKSQEAVFCSPGGMLQHSAAERNNSAWAFSRCVYWRRAPTTRGSSLAMITSVCEAARRRDRSWIPRLASCFRSLHG